MVGFRPARCRPLARASGGRAVSLTLKWAARSTRFKGKVTIRYRGLDFKPIASEMQTSSQISSSRPHLSSAPLVLTASLPQLSSCGTILNVMILDVYSDSLCLGFSSSLPPVLTSGPNCVSISAHVLSFRSQLSSLLLVLTVSQSQFLFSALVLTSGP